MGSPTIPNPSPVILQTALVDTATGVINRNWYPFFYLAQAALNSPGMPVFNVLSYGSKGDGATQDQVGIQAAYNAAVAAGGGTVYLPPVPAYYNITGPLILNSPVPVTIMGSGMAGLIKRTANMPQGMGVFDMTGAKYLTFTGLAVDGNVLTPTELLYSQFGYITLSLLLTGNTSFWMHSGCSYITFNGLLIKHTGGYAILGDADTLDITDLLFQDVALLDNRPHLFGVSNPIYGSWTGGILLTGNGVTNTAMIRRARHINCSARRCTGNAFWQHLNGFSSTHTDITYDGTFGEDLGRDLIQPGGVTGMRIDGVLGRRIGYVTLDDTSQSIPRWESGNWAVAIDGGVCYGVTMTNINLLSCNGGGFDIDGMQFVNLSNFSVRVPLPDEPAYIEDQIGTIGWAGSTTSGGPNAAYGVLLAQAYYNVLGEGSHTVTGGSISNCSNGAVKVFGSRNNHISALNIYHPPANTGAPISMGNVGPTEFNQSFGNTIANLRIEYEPTAPSSPCVLEDDGTPFISGNYNEVLGIEVVNTNGNAIPFQKAASSSSFGSINADVDTGTYTGTLSFFGGYLINK